MQTYRFTAVNANAPSVTPERSPPTNVSRVRFPDPASYVGWVCCWFSSISKFQFDLDYCRALHHEPLARLIAQALLVFDFKFTFTLIRLRTDTARRDFWLCVTSCFCRMPDKQVSFPLLTRLSLVQYVAWCQTSCIFFGLIPDCFHQNILFSYFSNKRRKFSGNQYQRRNNELTEFLMIVMKYSALGVSFFPQ